MEWFPRDHLEWFVVTHNLEMMAKQVMMKPLDAMDYCKALVLYVAVVSFSRCQGLTGKIDRAIVLD